MRTGNVINRGWLWVGFLAVAGVGVMSLTMIRAQEPPPAAPPAGDSAGSRPDEARAVARALVIQLTEQVQSQRAQLQQAEASLERARALLRSLGGEVGAVRPTPGALPSLPPPPPPDRSPFEPDLRGASVDPPPASPARSRRVTPSPSAPLLDAPSRNLPEAKGSGRQK